MKKILLPMIIILILLIIIVSILLINLLKQNNNITESSQEKIGHIDFTEVDKLTTRNEYYAVKQVVNQYYHAMNQLDPNIEDLDIAIDITSEEQKQNIIDQYTQQSVEILQDMIDTEAIQTLSFTKENLAQKMKPYKSSTFTVEEIDYVKKSVNISIYYVIGLLDSGKQASLIVKTDSYTQTFSIYPQEYIERNHYDKNSIQNNFNTEGIEYITKNSHNHYVIHEITDQIMAQYYLYDYGDMVNNNLEKAYELLNENYKEKRFPTYQEYANYIQNSNKTYQLLELKSYSVKEKEGYNEFTCQDQYGNTYIFEEKSIMDYTVQLDSYTLENETFNEQYKTSNGRDRGILNIEKFFEMIHMQDYTSAYVLLDENFKQNYFKTQVEFENYMKNKVFRYNSVNYKEYSNQITDIYIYKVTLTDATKQSSQEIEFNIVMKLLEGTNFVMSFDVN